MSALEDWQARNDTSLGAALAQVRSKLERAARALGEPTDAAEDREPETQRSGGTLWSRLRRPSSAVSSDKARPTRLLSAPDGASPEAGKVAEATDRTQSVDAPALSVLCDRLGLSPFERDVLLLCAGVELDTRFATLCALAQGEPTRPFPTYALAMALFDEPAWDALSPGRPLRYWRLLEISQLGAQPLTASALRVDERIVSFIKGLNYLDDRLSSLVTPMTTGTLDELPVSQQTAVWRIVSLADGPPRRVTTVLLAGRDSQSKRHVAGAMAAVAGLHLYRLPVEVLPVHESELETLARLWQRECLLLPLALYVDAHDLDRAALGSAADNTMQRLTRFLARTGGLVFVDVREGAGSPLDMTGCIEVEKPTPGEQQSIWSIALGDEAADSAALLAGQFNLSQHDIGTIIAKARTDDGASTLHERVWQGCIAKTRPRLDRLAERIDAKATWDDIVLPKPEVALLRHIVAQVQSRSEVYDDWGFRSRMNRGFGITALFGGDSGTGKTMAAEVLANALALDLYRIDLSAVVSKYIGETEKNLRQVFDSAEDGGAILLFDEADALFGKRSEVKDSHDRYANVEINYLLQRMEAYRGLAILATNMKSALDHAFMRRLRFIVNFPFPGPVERRQLWEKAFPSSAPIGALDFERLSRLSLTGGNIHSIALNAAFLAVRSRTPVTMGLVLEACRVEFRKMDRPVNEADVRWGEVEEVRA